MKPVSSMIKKTLMFATAVVLSACAGKDIIHQPDQAERTGVPYRLPKTFIDIELGHKTLGSQSHIVLKSSTRHVPDHSELYLLDPTSESWLTTTDHHFVVDQGLIKSVNTTDIAEGGAVLENVTTSLINLGKSATFVAQSAKSKAFNTVQSFPTPEELLQISQMLTLSGTSITIDPNAVPTVRVPVPATNGILYLTFNESYSPPASVPYTPLPAWPVVNNLDTSKIETQCDAAGEINASRELALFPSAIIALDHSHLGGRPPVSSSSAPAGKLASSNNTVYGLFTKALREFDLTLHLYVDLWKLREYRIERMVQDFERKVQDLHEALDSKDNSNIERRGSQACRSNQAEHAQLNQQVAALTNMALLGGDRLNKEFIDARLKILRADLARLDNDVNSCENRKQNVWKNIASIRDQCRRVAAQSRNILQTIEWRPQQDYLMARNDQILQVAGDEVVSVPLTRATMGKTTNDLKFVSGFLTDFHQVKPSEGKVLTESIVNSTTSLYDALVAIAQIPAEALGLKLDEINAQQSLTDGQIILNNKRDLLQGKRHEIQSILLDAHLEAVRADPAAHLELLNNIGLDIVQSGADSEEAADAGGDSEATETSTEDTPTEGE
ncbi:MAG: hypothetical protein AAF431_07025 [Pseudomonadota bacterium]